MDFLAGEDGLSTAGMRYTMTAVDLDLTADRLARAGIAKGTVSDLFTDLPDDLPAMVEDLAEEVTRTAATPYEKAVALQDWFREDGGFEYSLDRAEGSGSDALVDFLSERPGGRVGYCEQFASAMAVMARMVGIPARIGVGFLSPDSTGPNTYEYSAHDMHAWPELYIDGGGWVRFEPTPSARVADVPDYTEPQSAADDDPSETAGPTRPSPPPHRAPGLGRPSTRLRAPTPATVPTRASPGCARSARRSPSCCSSPVSCCPGRCVAGGARSVSRPARPNRSGPSCTTPRSISTSPGRGRDHPARPATGSSSTWGLRSARPPTSAPPTVPRSHPEAVDALDRIVLALELERYARPGSRPVTADVRAACEPMARPVSPPWRVVRRATPGAGHAGGHVRWSASDDVGSAPTGPTVEARYGGVVDHVGARGPTA